MKTAYIIEDELMVRELLTDFFSTEFPGVKVVGSSGDGRTATKDCLESRPDLVIVDIQLPEVNGLEILHFLKSELPRTKVLIFTGRTSPQSVKIAMLGSVDGYVTKISGLKGLKEAIQACQSDDQYYSPEVEEEIARSGNST